MKIEKVKIGEHTYTVRTPTVRDLMQARNRILAESGVADPLLEQRALLLEVCTDEQGNKLDEKVLDEMVESDFLKLLAVLQMVRRPDKKDLSFFQRLEEKIAVSSGKPSSKTGEN